MYTIELRYYLFESIFCDLNGYSLFKLNVFICVFYNFYLLGLSYFIGFIFYDILGNGLRKFLFIGGSCVIYFYEDGKIAVENVIFIAFY